MASKEATKPKANETKSTLLIRLGPTKRKLFKLWAVQNETTMQRALENFIDKTVKEVRT